MTDKERSPLLWLLACATMLALVALSWWAPQSLPPVPPSVDAGLFGRVYPGVDVAWVGARLGFMFVAILAWTAVALHRAGYWPVDPRISETKPVQGVVPAVAVSLLHLVSWFWIGDLPLAGQGAWVIAAVLPALILAVSNRAPGANLTPAFSPWLAPVAIWLVWRVGFFPDPMRLADTVDTWMGLERARAVAGGTVGLLGDEFLPGAPNIYMVLEGVPFFHLFDRVPSAMSLIVVHACWWGVSAALLARVVARRLGPTAALVAAAALLFSPFALHTHYSLLPIFLGPLATVGLIWLIDRWRLDGSAWSLALAGPVIGIAAGVPALVPIAGLAGATFLWTAWRRGASALLLAAFLIPLVAIALPAIPSAATIDRMVADYTTGSGVWITLERVLMGQLAPSYVIEGWSIGDSGIFDVPLSAMLSPWLSARTPLRAWGDNLYDPLSAVAFGVGLLLALRAARRRPEAAWLVVALALCMAPGLLSSYDRPSHTRMLCAPALWAMLAAVGVHGVARTLVSERLQLVSVGWALAAATLAVGLFDVADAEKLERSFLSISLRAAGRQSAPAHIVEHPSKADLGWLHFDRITEALASANVQRTSLADAEAALGAATPSDAAWFVSPGLEQSDGAVTLLCQRAPDASVLILTGITGYNRAFAVTRDVAAWTPKPIGATEIVNCSSWPGAVPAGDEHWARP
ncbi:MAG: hypothetical protein ACI8TX_001831 [Hyphomicrobiaceae bacterium]|jgi:hypothetical protein